MYRTVHGRAARDSAQNTGSVLVFYDRSPWIQLNVYIMIQGSQFYNKPNLFRISPGTRVARITGQVVQICNNKSGQIPDGRFGGRIVMG